MNVLAPRHLNAFEQSRLALRQLKSLLRAIEKGGKHCADEVILAGLFVGAGSIYIAEKLQQSNTFGFQLLVNVSLNLAGPIACALLIAMRLGPHWVRDSRAGLRASWPRVVVPAAIIGAILNFYFFWASIVAGVLISSRQDMIGEFKLVLATAKPSDFAFSSIEAMIYVIIASLWVLAESLPSLKQGKPVALVSSSVTVHVFAVVMVTKIAWTFARQIIF